MDFLWSGHHWRRAAVLHQLVHEGGQGLVDLESTVAAFRLQAAQKLLYSADICWGNPAWVLLQRASGTGLD